ncbi:hypothetical protein CLU96_0611 [Chryseobacterium sp. 52]|nr:hypothetical protein CLU96_0611 [Chryseobacterium sp. 52]
MPVFSFFLTKIQCKADRFIIQLIVFSVHLITITAHLISLDCGFLSQEVISDKEYVYETNFQKTVFNFTVFNGFFLEL